MFLVLLVGCYVDCWGFRKLVWLVVGVVIGGVLLVVVFLVYGVLCLIVLICGGVIGMVVIVL